MALHIQPSNLSHLMSVPGSYTVKMETEMVTNERKEEQKFGRLEKKRIWVEQLSFPFFLIRR